MVNTILIIASFLAFLTIVDARYSKATDTQKNTEEINRHKAELIQKEMWAMEDRFRDLYMKRYPDADYPNNEQIVAFMEDVDEDAFDKYNILKKELEELEEE